MTLTPVNCDLYCAFPVCEFARVAALVGGVRDAHHAGEQILAFLYSARKGCLLLQARQPQGIVFWVNVLIIVVYSLGGLLAAVGSIRQIILHSRTYNLFH